MYLIIGGVVLVIILIAVAVYFGTKVPDIDCELSGWSTCDPITNKQTNAVLKEKSGNGKDCGLRTQDCVPKKDCVYTDSWGSCDRLSKTQRRSVVEASGGGTECDESKMTRTCTPANDCVYTVWGKCDPATGYQTRSISSAATGDGVPCSSDQMRQPCDIDCEMSKWSSCDKTTKKTTRTVVTQPKNSGLVCPTDVSKDCLPTNTAGDFVIIGNHGYYGGGSQHNVWGPTDSQHLLFTGTNTDTLQSYVDPNTGKTVIRGLDGWYGQNRNLIVNDASLPFPWDIKFNDDRTKFGMTTTAPDGKTLYAYDTNTYGFVSTKADADSTGFVGWTLEYRNNGNPAFTGDGYKATGYV